MKKKTNRTLSEQRLLTGERGVEDLPASSCTSLERLDTRRRDCPAMLPVALVFCYLLEPHKRTYHREPVPTLIHRLTHDTRGASKGQ